jgi:hypothetical protein
MASSPSLPLLGALDHDELAATPPHPAPLTASQIPAYLAENPLVKLYLELSPEEETTLAGLAASDASEDTQVAQALVASIR